MAAFTRKQDKAQLSWHRAAIHAIRTAPHAVASLAPARRSRSSRSNAFWYESWSVQVEKSGMKYSRISRAESMPSRWPSFHGGNIAPKVLKGSRRRFQLSKSCLYRLRTNLYHERYMSRTRPVFISFL